MPGSPSGCGTCSQLWGPLCGWLPVRVHVKDSEPSLLPVGTPRMSSSPWNGHTCLKTAMITISLSRTHVEGRWLAYSYGPYPATNPADGTTHSHAADRVILDRQALAPLSAAACRTGSVIPAAKPIASHRAEGEPRESWPGRSGCRRCPRSGFRAGDGHQPWVIQRSGTR